MGFDGYSPASFVGLEDDAPVTGRWKPPSERTDDEHDSIERQIAANLEMMRPA